MKVFKCFFVFEDGVTKEKKSKIVFSEEDSKEHIQRLLELNMFTNDDCLIHDLVIIKAEIYDGMVIS